MAKTPDYFGNFPFKPDEKRPCKMTQNDLKMFIYTEEFPESSDLNWVIASTQHMTVGEYQLSPGSTFDPVDIHAGDEVYYVEYGTVTMLNPETGQAEEIHEGETILMPKGAAHKAYNFTNDITKILYVIAPKIWDENGPPLDYDKMFQLYKQAEREGK